MTTFGARYKSYMYAMFGILLSLCLVLPAAAQDQAGEAKQQAQKTLPDTPAEKSTDRQVAVGVSHTGTDAIGAALAFKLKELFNGSSLFRLTAKDEKKVTLIIRTQSEFQDRAEIGSVYSVVWCWSENEETLKYYLAAEVGTVSEARMDAVVKKLAEVTDETASKYTYLFE